MSIFFEVLNDCFKDSNKIIRFKELKDKTFVFTLNDL